ncbi:uncharacterized protein LOC129320174 [Prosopis cineraria]|uniref:uncharacterized protein LOC129298045 n=1 Tax=Prosopis cineraria TaxID=364024 RepID=UPI00240F3F0F|nr:uncharacterized protein LOC129298045 [Prosopis cineraria]XP_054792409.1 uncharacterized protein LOC129298045 [Prosopis cineraria]XP_054821404.1 uncharacterized protein LOC129320174 [Prosopis cineraria]XP_054821406.1 uncharacterized protein LOC129320174 [Prosopis cineraria]
MVNGNTSIDTMLWFRSKPCFLRLFFFLFLFAVLFISASPSSHPLHSVIPDSVDLVSLRPYHAKLTQDMRRPLADDTAAKTSLVLARERTRRKDPLDHFNLYNGGWNISNQHYYASVIFTAVPFFVIAAAWFVMFGLCLSLICLCYCCCPTEPYGYSRVAYALSLIFLILFTLAAIAGCVILYTGQGKFYTSTSKTLDYVVSQADFTAKNLMSVSSYLDTAKVIGVDAVFLPPNVQKNINDVKSKIDNAAATLSSQTKQNSKDIQNGINGMRSTLIIVAAAMLFLAFLGFLFSMCGIQSLVYFLVIVGWILVAGTFILCGVFLFLHNVVGDSCVAMDEWVQHPTAHTALDNILPCVDNGTAQEALFRSKEVTYQLVMIVDSIISNVTNRNFPSSAGPLYYNQSGPPMPFLCSPFDSNLTPRQCAVGEVTLHDATKVWRNYTCRVSSSGICSSPGRMTPAIYSQMVAAVNVSYGLYHYSPFLINLADCSFVRKTFKNISNNYCPNLLKYSLWIYVGLVVVSAAVMLSLIFWVIYARERWHRIYTKLFVIRRF